VALNERQRATIEFYSSFPSIMDAGKEAEKLDSNDLITRTRNFYNWLTIPEFKTAFEKEQHSYLEKIKSELNVKNVYLHSRVLDSLCQKAESSKLSTRGEIEILKVTSREEFQFGKKALKKAKRIHEKIIEGTEGASLATGIRRF